MLKAVAATFASNYSAFKGRRNRHKYLINVLIDDSRSKKSVLSELSYSIFRQIKEI